ncbi:MAG TPA: LamG-like jellyroll fold domain-containing protein, partial [Verrucomicrobiae bacterium]|nr:LamG-like jellyroll fold domain-containing protein [Verrucomicrobiae bacterium]
PADGVQAIYTNGILEASRSFPANQTPLSSVATNEASLGQSPWHNYGDPYMAGSISEFRIWNGALNPLQVAALDAAGTGTVSTNYGTVTAIQLQVAFTQPQYTMQQAAVLATASGLTTQPNIATLASYSSGDTNILTVSAGGVITAVAQGSTTVTASYGGNTSTQTITVVPPAATLAHRYSFTSDASDSVGGANGTLQGTATFDGNGNVVLDGSSGCYVSLPTGVLTNLAAVTFETWLTNGVSPDNVCQFEFSSGSGTGGSYLRHVIHDQSNGRNQFEMTAGATSDLIGNPGFGGQYVHVVCVYDPTAQVQAVFTNGVLSSVQTGVSIPPVSGLWTFQGSLGRSPWWAYGDPYMSGAIDEFRIYSGELTPQKIAMDYAAGPNNFNTNSEGALVSIALQVASTMPMSSSQKYGLLVNYQNLTNFDIINNSIFPVTGLTVTSSDTNIISVGANKLLTAGTPGMATLTAVYQGITNTAVVTVQRPPLAALIHRWSFGETTGTTAADSIGGADATLQGTAAFDGAGDAVLDGSSGCYVSLPTGVLTNLTAVTFEIWLTNSLTPDNVCEFAISDGTGTGGSYIRHVIHDQSNGRNQFEMTSGGTSDLLGNPGFGGQYVHVVCVYDPTTLVQQVFTNGVLASSKTGVGLPPLSGLWADGGSLGRSPWWAYGDPYLSGAISEFRIYAGRLLPDEIQASDIVGPDTLLTTNVSMSAAGSGNGQVSFSWPVAGPGFTLYSSPTLGPDAVWTVVTNAVTIVGQTYQVNLSSADGTKFFRLQR